MNLMWNITLLVCTFYLRNNGVDAGHLRILGGAEASIEDHPWIVSILYPRIGFKCAGSLISEDTVLTAGHCLRNPDSQPISVVLGTADRSHPGTTIKVKEAKKHENYSLEDLNLRTEKANYDIGYIKLADKVPFSDKIRPIKLPEKYNKVPLGTPLVVAGWGKTTPTGSASTILKEAKVTAAHDDNVCTSEEKFCAGGRTLATCSGDSGGPLELDGTLIGIVSFGYNDCIDSDEPAGYANVAFFRTWIKNQTGV
ncbi:trypsin-3 isoform X1 [Diabrotica virgifera virgifera]|uniref:trypsin n=1 Tax=Diabrotica virgifera virgifera TaxID=50390 RepID=A0A6P7FJE5_DIAVI|nr:trypsin-3 isoform X1 [Diabrotica virgifera virgifera]